MKKRVLLLLGVTLCLVLPSSAQSKSTVDAALRRWFAEYTTTECELNRCKLQSTELNKSSKTLAVHASSAFGEQPFRQESVDRIYAGIRSVLPSPVNRYRVTVYVDGVAIDDLVPNSLRKKKDTARMWTKAENPKEAPWVTNTSLPYAVTDGLQGRHLAINASHGIYYKNGENKWLWQRPSLFCTREDLLTQSIVFPYLIPMLERAGAVVFTSRERDNQRHEVVVDNDSHGLEEGLYVEEHGKRSEWTDVSEGFFTPESVLYNGDNPFANGTARSVQTIRNARQSAAAMWMPNIPERGRYAVYVSYPTLPGSVPDAHYIVLHRGGMTHFLVNQQMGGGTWVYLGTFEFDKGSSEQCMVVLTNESTHAGVVCADAVRFGGGMGNVSRGEEPDSMSVSGMPRYLEGTRYWAQYAGFPYAVYANRDSKNDYNEDINARSYVGNALLGGSVYAPDSVGRRVPLELAFALHTDAGIKPEGIVGTLGICTTAYHDGLLGDGRLSRFASRDLVDEVQTSVTADLRRSGYAEWTRRGLWDRNYSESRISDVPSMILELLAHQNFNDMKVAHDPTFKFTVARAIYKGLLRQVTAMHGDSYTVQPLPPDHLSLLPLGPTAPRHYRLSWQGVGDPLEPTAKPTAYVVYTRVGDGDFDNGRLVETTHLDIDLADDLIYSFRVTAVNKGGESFPSETLAAGIPANPRGQVLVVNGFDRLSGPSVVETADSLGFDLLDDPGVPYVSTTAFSGYQHDFNRAAQRLGNLGTSDDALVGRVLMGNTFDYAAVHGAALMAAGYAFSSVSRQCFEQGDADPEGYTAVDVYLGLQKDGALSEALCQRLSTYAMKGGNLFVSGSYVGMDSAGAASSLFLSDVLGCHHVGADRAAADRAVSGQQLTMPFFRSFNDVVYPLVAPRVLTPLRPSDTNFAVFVYDDSRRPAAVAYDAGSRRAVTLGFPFEAVGNAADRARAMTALMAWLTERKQPTTP